MAIALMILCGEAVAAPRNQFDLVCRSSGGNETRMSIDIAARQWCFRLKNCQLQKLVDVHPTELVLRDEETDSPANGYFRSKVVINRATGTLEYYHGERRGGGLSRSSSPEPCEVAPFTLMPQPKF